MYNSQDLVYDVSMSQRVAHIQVVASWLERGHVRRVLGGASLDFTENRSLFRVTFEAKLTLEQFSVLAAYWQQNPGVHLSMNVLQYS